MKPPNPRLKLLRQLRKQIKTVRHFQAEHIEGRRVRYTCKTCGWSGVDNFGGKNGPTDVKMIQRLVAYQNQAGGAYGDCPRCTEKARNERYPLP